MGGETENRRRRRGRRLEKRKRADRQSSGKVRGVWLYAMCRNQSLWENAGVIECFGLAGSLPKFSSYSGMNYPGLCGLPG